MTQEELDRLRDWMSTLSADEIQGVKDALARIAAGRMHGGGGKMPKSEAEIDPDLEQPEDDPMDRSMDPDTEIDDPDHVLDHDKSDDEGDDGDGKDLDSPDEEDSDDSEGKSEKSKSKEKETHGKSDASTDTEEDETDSDDAEEEGTPGDEKDLIDDTDSDLPSELADDKEKTEAKKQEVFRRKVEISTARKQIKRALSKATKTPDLLTDEDKSDLEKKDKELSDLFDKIKENPDSITDMSADEFNAMIKQVLDAVDKAGVKHIEIKDVPSRVKKLETDLEDPLTIDELNDEDSENRARDPEFQKMKAREKEKERLQKEIEASRSLFSKGNIETFKADLKRAIGDQVQEMIDVEEETYAIVNRHHEEDDIAVPGIRIDEIPDEKKPTIDVYFDQSGSWGTAEVEKGMAALKDILQLEKEGLLILNIYYFSKILSQDQKAARLEGSQECWDLVIENIMAEPKTKNVIIMTDTDIGYDYGYAGHHGCIKGAGGTVQGCVWYLWKRGRRVPEARTKLKGLKGTFEYSV